MCISAIFMSAVLYIVNANSIYPEDAPSYRYYGNAILDSPDINTNSLALLTGETPPPFPLLKEDDFFLGNTSPQFAEFQLDSITETSAASSKASTLTTTATIYTSTSKLEANTLGQTGGTDNTNTRLPREEDEMSKVLPHKVFQRGVLDLLFPATRVKNFKSMFDTVRRLLSHTF